MSASNIRNLINLLESIEQDQALPKVLEVPRDQLEQVASSLKRSLELLNKKDLDEANWGKKLAATAMTAAALGGGMGQADAQTSAPRPQAQVQQQQEYTRIPRNTLRDCFATLSAVNELQRTVGLPAHGSQAILNKYKQLLVMSVVKDPNNAGAGKIALDIEAGIVDNLAETYKMMSQQELARKGTECLNRLQQAGIGVR